MATIFGLYAYSEHEVDRANDRLTEDAGAQRQIGTNRHAGKPERQP